MGTTSQKITYLNVTKANLKKVINAIGGNLTDNSTFRSYAALLNSQIKKSINGEIDLWNKYPKDTVTGTTITLSNSELNKIGITLDSTDIVHASGFLPSQYTQVDYIETNGSQYIDTGYKGKLNSEVRMRVTNNHYSGQLLGDITTTSSAMSCNFGASSLGSRFGDVVGSAALLSYITYNTPFDFVYNKTGVYIDGTERISFNTTTSFTTTNNIFLMNRNSSSGATSAGWIGRLYYCKIFEDGTLVRHFIPCYRNSDNEIGLYDVVNDVFYTKQGSDSFTKGSNTVLPTPEYPVKINTITGYNNINITDGSEEQNYPIHFNSKNIFDYDNVEITRLGNDGNMVVFENKIIFSASNQTVYGITIDLGGLNLKNNTTYTVSNLFTNTDSNREPAGWRYYNGSSYTVLNSYRTYFTFTTTSSGVNQLLYYIGSPATYNGTLTLYNIQLLEGNIAQENIPTYIPYISTPIEYGNIENHKEQIFKNTTDSSYYDNTLVEGDWYLKKNVGKVTYNGNETGWAMLGMTNGKQFYINHSNVYHDNSKKLLMSNYFISGKIGDRDTIKDTVYSFSTGIAFNPKTTVANSLDDWKTWLSTHNTEVYYPLSTPTYIHITQTDYPTLYNELENIYNNTKSYDGTTYVIQTNDELSFTLQIETLKDLEV